MGISLSNDKKSFWVTYINGASSFKIQRYDLNGTLISEKTISISIRNGTQATMADNKVFVKTNADDLYVYDLETDLTYQTPSTVVIVYSTVFSIVKLDDGYLICGIDYWLYKYNEKFEEVVKVKQLYNSTYMGFKRKGEVYVKAGNAAPQKIDSNLILAPIEYLPPSVLTPPVHYVPCNAGYICPYPETSNGKMLLLKTEFKYGGNSF